LEHEWAIGVSYGNYRIYIDEFREGGKLEDIIFRIVIGVKNDALSQSWATLSEAEINAEKLLAATVQNRIEKAVLELKWVSDLLIEREA